MEDNVDVAVGLPSRRPVSTNHTKSEGKESGTEDARCREMGRAVGDRGSGDLSGMKPVSRVST